MTAPAETTTAPATDSNPTSFTADLGVNPPAPGTASPLEVLVEADDGDTDLADVDEGVDTKSNGDYRVVFKRATGKKKLPLSVAAAELITKLRFARMLGVPAEIEGEEAPKRRGRKPKATQEQAKASSLSMEFVDDAMNVSIDFVESLTSYEPFRVFVFLQNEEGTDVERFTFKDVRILPTPQWCEFQAEGAGHGLRIPVNFTYGSVARKSLVSTVEESESTEE